MLASREAIGQPQSEALPPLPPPPSEEKNGQNQPFLAKKKWPILHQTALSHSLIIHTKYIASHLGIKTRLWILIRTITQGIYSGFVFNNSDKKPAKGTGNIWKESGDKILLFTLSLYYYILFHGSIQPLSDQKVISIGWLHSRSIGHIHQYSWSQSSRTGRHTDPPLQSFVCSFNWSSINVSEIPQENHFYQADSNNFAKYWRNNYSVIPILKMKQKFRGKGCDFGDFV